MSQNKEIVDLLKNIQEGLQHHSPEELNAAIVEILNRKDDKVEEINFIITSVCDKFNISKRTLKKSKARGHHQQARQLAYVLLHRDLGLPIRYIAKRIFDKWPNSVNVAIKYHRDCDEKIPSEKEFLSLYAELQNQLIDYTKRQNE